MSAPIAVKPLVWSECDASYGYVQFWHAHQHLGGLAGYIWADAERTTFNVIMLGCTTGIIATVDSLEEAKERVQEEWSAFIRAALG